MQPKKGDAHTHNLIYGCFFKTVKNCEHIKNLLILRTSNSIQFSSSKHLTLTDCFKAASSFTVRKAEVTLFWIKVGEWPDNIH